MIEEKNIHTKKITALFASFLLVLLAYQGFYRFGFGSDTMIHYLNPLINIESELTYGRYIPYIIDIVLYKAGIILPDEYRVFYLLFIISTTVAAFLYQQVYIESLEKKGIVLSPAKEYAGRAILSLPFISTLYAEYFMFPECFVYSLGFAFSAFAVYFFSKNKYVAAVIFLLLASASYQVTVIVSAIYALIYIVVDGDFVLNKKMFAKGLISSICCVGAGFLNYLTMTAVYVFGILPDSPKTLSDESIIQSIKRVIYLFISFLKNGVGLVSFPYANLLIAALAIVLMFIYKKNEKGIFATFIFAGFIAFVLALVIPLIQSNAPRVIFVLYAAFGCTLFLAFAQLQGKESMILLVAIILTVFIQIFSCQQIVVNHYISNTQDLDCARAVLSEIDEYEKETGNTVSTIAVCMDKRSENYYDNVYYTLWQINERVTHNVAYSLLEYVNKQNTGTGENRFEKSSLNEKDIRSKYFDGMDWDSLDLSKQLVIEGDTAYWCIY